MNARHAERTRCWLTFGAKAIRFTIERFIRRQLCGTKKMSTLHASSNKSTKQKGESVT
jgi:hypothetical protein